MGGGDKRIYGVKFDGTNSTGTRLLAAKKLNFSPSSTTTIGVDDFITIEDSPFHIRECISNYNSSTGKQEIIAYEGDSNWNTLVANKIGNRMIEFPKFYYNRPSKWEFYVSSDEKPRFLPSPMHYRAGKMHDYVYVAKYFLNSNLVSQTNQNIRVGTNAFGDQYSMGNTRTSLRQKGLYILDYQSWSMITILAFIKYNEIDIQSYIGAGWTLANNPTLTGGSDGIRGKDGYSASNKDNNGHTVIFGIEDMYGQVWHHIDGGFKYHEYFYFNNDIENIVVDPTKSNYSAYTKFNTPTLNDNKGCYLITDISFDPSQPWIMIPTDGIFRPNFSWPDPKNDTMIGCGFWTWPETDEFCQFWLGSPYNNGWIAGLMYFGANDPIGNAYAYTGYKSMFLSESYT